MSMTEQQWTVSDLHRAAQAGDFLTVNKCLDADVDINAIQGASKSSALHVAAECGNSEIVEFLVSLGANKDAADNHGQRQAQGARARL